MGMPLKPDDMQSLLTHDRRYQRASAILTDQWQRIMADEELAYRQQITIDDLRFAKALLASELLTSSFEFEHYAGVQHLRQHYGSHLTGAAQKWLVQKYL
ncbi:hypothetical protein N7X57_14255 [Lactiplantibacillus paraplantarum]|nr:hypothetical protein [Lactiplantibacillus paraplantarum]OAX75046.1 hypothetical protein A0U96_12690 [Lactiplantibacillus plantarum]ALO05352.1 hypothetical protein ASU28_13830 [Lactiplantibacillus paraplantarum]KGE74799.1 hypothetical protein HR47_11320 [Lactiplantibacillus paraplantarum]MCW1911588.1 hypothetical protein [Lactiplantibacillus paraplantarum]RDG11728.1 hypothetical protein DQM08_07765 [Lactiplantibacillus paraplantarum]